MIRLIVVELARAWGKITFEDSYGLWVDFIRYVCININIGTAHIKASAISFKFKLERPEISSETISI